MNERVERFIESVKKEEFDKRESWKKKQLMAWGLTEKEYSCEGVQSERYNLVEVNEEGKALYYREVPIEVSDEEFEAMENAVAEKELCKWSKGISSNENYFEAFKSLPKILFWISVTVSVLTGLLLAAIYDGAFLLVGIVGVVVSFITYILTKIMISPIVLTVEYLYLLLNKNK